jgi:hypothetical protein
MVATLVYLITDISTCAVQNLKNYELAQDVVRVRKPKVKTSIFVGVQMRSIGFSSDTVLASLRNY